VNPSTGRKALFIDPKTVTGVDGLPEDEANDLLDRLLAHTIRPENVYDHDWQPGDLVLWDNWRAMHCTTGTRAGVKRLIHRTTIEGDHTLGRQL
jgi:taurine dioxygenase